MPSKCPTALAADATNSVQLLLIILNNFNTKHTYTNSFCSKLKAKKHETSSIVYCQESFQEEGGRGVANLYFCCHILVYCVLYIFDLSRRLAILVT